MQISKTITPQISKNFNYEFDLYYNMKTACSVVALINVHKIVTRTKISHNLHKKLLNHVTIFRKKLTPTIVLVMFCQKVHFIHTLSTEGIVSSTKFPSSALTFISSHVALSPCCKLPKESLQLHWPARWNLLNPNWISVRFPSLSSIPSCRSHWIHPVTYEHRGVLSLPREYINILPRG